MTDKLMIRPQQASYATQAPEEVLYAALDGGKGYYRADIIGGSTPVDVAWTLRDVEYQAFMAFFRRKTLRGSEPFLIDLLIEDTLLQEYTAHFIPGSLKPISGINGSVIYVTARLEVEAIDADDDFDDATIYLYDISQGHPRQYVDWLEEIVNDILPEYVA